MPRIIAGKAKGTRLVTPKGLGSRPTSDRMKEALFSILSDRVEGSAILDVFSGSGQIALEALSRGAQKAVMIEKDRDAVLAIRQNIEKTRLSEGAVLLPGDYLRHLKALVQEGARFDLIYVDPPWKLNDEVMRSLDSILPKLLLPDAFLIIETDSKAPLEVLFDTALTRVRGCQYGSGVLSFYQLKTDSK